MANQNFQKTLFDLGRTVATPSAIEVLQQSDVEAASLLYRHQCGDWGDLENEDILRNNEALRLGSRLFSSYQITKTTKIWVITEVDRSGTILLLPRLLSHWRVDNA